jgi:hypothetical protein
MRQGFVFVLASAVLLAGVASAHVFAPLPDGTPFQSSAKAATPAPGQSSSSKPFVEIRQAPVPLQTRERAPVVLPPVVETASATPQPQAGIPMDGEAGKFAKGAIEADGYKAVKNITPGPDGTWRARALRGKTEVVLTVDREGRVSAD